MLKTEKILILAKTYPSPSANHVETSCIAGINENGEMRRLYPVPFRLINKNQQFSKWQWITADIKKNSRDRREESHQILVHTIEPKETLSPKNQWKSRRQWIEKIPTFTNFEDLEISREKNRISLAILKPKKIIKLDITATSSEWTKEEKEKLLAEQMQGQLFSEDEAKKQIQMLEKIPFDFHYHYVCDTSEGEKEFRHKIVDWEAGSLYRNCQKTHKANWKKPFLEKYEDNFSKKDLMFLMGNIHRFQNQWLIISVIYPPQLLAPTSQQDLFSSL